MTARHTIATRPITTHPYPTRATIAAHLTVHHTNTGLDVDVIAAHHPDELLLFHEQDHHYCATGFLGHDHSAIATTDPAPDGSVDSDRRIHEANLRAVREGKRIANLDEILRRAAQASARRMAATTDPATGARIPGAGRLSQADHDALEIEQAIAARAARRAKRASR
ncbi:MAG TPA: hypothetical protein P5193_04500 [Microthrixaceae bacterium]|nr:hypothetical protein [Microthrixaceae bacterium]